ncbi:MAG: 4-phosphoerythronate dehydrogenase [Gammaproteobacteria bacterium]|nr:4-phosphoerythronate dehydrogenase [Gammaproteobacteria bacterium]
MVRDRDALLVRSVTRIDGRLLEGSRVRFVGSATAGTDHVDRDWLAAHGVGFAHAPGSNAPSVVDYVLSVLSVFAGEDGRALADYTVGVVGCGAVGGRLVARLGALGVPCLRNDPPLARTGAGTGFVTIEELLARADVVTLHVPLTTAGTDATAGLLHAGRLGTMRRGATLINAARGGVVDEHALGRALAAGRLRAALDCWEDEPGIASELLERVTIGTPHIAGYALDGKLAATRMLHTALCSAFGREDPWPLAALAPLVPPVPERTLAPGPADACVRALVLACYDVRRDAAALAAGVNAPRAERAVLFDRLRRDYPARREFAAIPVRIGPAGDGSLHRQIAGAGFTVVD